MEPQGGGEPIVRTGEVILDGLPAAGRIYDREDPWLPDPFGGLPFAIARRSGADAVTWPAVASQAAAVFRSALESDGERAWVARARALVEGAKSPLEKAARLAAFVQAMAYRDLAWGVGAYRPERPSESLRSLSADCKGKSLLLQDLLAESGIRSTLVLCRVRTGYLERSPVPTLRAFNHVVLAIRLPGAEECPGALVEGAGRGAAITKRKKIDLEGML